MLRVRVLGAAAGGGYPQWNCNCAICQRAWAQPAMRRTQSSLAVTADDGGRWFLLNASPDLRQQVLHTPELLPRGGARGSPIAGVVLTNADVDHVAGLLSLREGAAFSLYASARVHGALEANGIFRVLAPERVPRRLLKLGRVEALRDARGEASGLEVEAFAVPGKVALYLEDPQAGEKFGTQPEDTIGLSVAEAGGTASFYYLPGCAELTGELAARLEAARCIFFDGTLWRDEELIAAGVGAKTGRRMGHMSISGPGGTLEAFAGLKLERKVFIHINNTNPILLEDSPERAAVEAAGWEVAWDGMEIRL